MALFSKIWPQKSNFEKKFKTLFPSSIRLIFHIWPLVAILNFALNEKLLCRLVCMVKSSMPMPNYPNQMNRIQMPSRNVNCGVKFGRCFDLWPPTDIFDFALTDEVVRKLVCRVKKYIHDKFCPNLMNEIQMPSRNGICGVKFGRFWTFDRRQPSWILS